MLQTLKSYLSYVDLVAFLSDDKQVVSGSKDKTVQLWDAATEAVLQTLKSYLSFVSLVVFLFNSNLLSILYISNY